MKNLPGNPAAALSSKTALLTLMAGLLSFSQGLSAQDSQALMVDVSPCLTLESPLDRLNCYEAQVKQTMLILSSNGARRYSPPAPATARKSLPETPPPAAREVENAELPPPSASGNKVALSSTPETGFGLEEENEKKSKVEEMYGTVASLKETIPNRYLITLENGQVWRQMYAEAYPLKVGHKVRIYSTRWGKAYRLTAEDLRSHIQVERVK